jgi:hypothetical protein
MREESQWNGENRPGNQRDEKSPISRMKQKTLDEPIKDDVGIQHGIGHKTDGKLEATVGVGLPIEVKERVSREIDQPEYAVSQEPVAPVVAV